MLLLSPLIMPSIVVAVGVFYILTFARPQLHGPRGCARTYVISMPVAILVLVAALRNFDRNLERAAISLGASPLSTTLKHHPSGARHRVMTAATVRVPAVLRRALISLFVSGINARTLPKKMWESLQELDPDHRGRLHTPRRFS